MQTGDLPGSIAVELEGCRVVLCLAGEIDLAVVLAFQQAHRGQPVAVDAMDAGAVSFMDLAGVYLMLKCKRDSATLGLAAALRRSSRAVDRVLRLTGLHGVLRGEGPPLVLSAPALTSEPVGDIVWMRR